MAHSDLCVAETYMRIYVFNTSGQLQCVAVSFNSYPMCEPEYCTQYCNAKALTTSLWHQYRSSIQLRD